MTDTTDKTISTKIRKSRNKWRRSVPAAVERGRKELPTPEVRCGGGEEQPSLHGAAAVGCRGAERSYSTFKVRRGGLRRYPSSKVRSRGCALLEQP